MAMSERITTHSDMRVLRYVKRRNVGHYVGAGADEEQGNGQHHVKVEQGELGGKKHESISGASVWMCAQTRVCCVLVCA